MLVALRMVEHTGHSRRLRLLLKERRLERGLSAQEVADRVAEELGKTSLSSTAIYNWERFERHPGVDAYAAWARVLGMRLHVDLEDARRGRRLMPVSSPEAAEVLLAMEAATPEKREAIRNLVVALLA